MAGVNGMLPTAGTVSGPRSQNCSYWELWPSSTGYAPSLEVLGRLAELYECSVGDLLSDYADFRDRDVEYGTRLELDRVREIVTEVTSDRINQGGGRTHRRNGRVRIRAIERDRNSTGSRQYRPTRFAAQARRGTIVSSSRTYNIGDGS
jgi:hypothetical protein